MILSRFLSSYNDKQFSGYFNDDMKGQGYSSNRRPESERRPVRPDSNNDDYWNKRPGYGNRDEDKNTRPEYDRRRPDYGDRDRKPEYNIRDRDQSQDNPRDRPQDIRDKPQDNRDKSKDNRDMSQDNPRDRWASTNRRRDPDGYFTDNSPVTSSSSVRDRHNQEASDSSDKYYSNEDFFQKRHPLESRESHLSYGK